MKPALIVLFTLGVVVTGAAQGNDAAPAKPQQDPKAVAMLEKLDSLQYSPRTAGLKDLEFFAKLPGKFNILIRWKAPDRVKAELVVAPETPPEIRKQMEFIKPKFEAEARKNAMPFVTMQLGESLREKHKDDDVTLAGPNEVKIVAKCEESKASFKEEVLTFDERGLVTRVKVVAPTGMESVIDPKFVERTPGRFSYESLKTTIGKDESVVSFEYVTVGDFTFVGKVITKQKDGEPRPLEFGGFKANSGLDDKIFDEAPAESRPAPPVR
jgi:hypothetical protein